MNALTIGNVPSGSTAYLIHRSLTQPNQPLIVIEKDLNAARRLAGELAHLYANHSDTPIHFFPDWEILPYDSFSPPSELISRRLNLLAKLPQLSKGIVVISITTLMHYVPPLKWLLGERFHFQVGQQLNTQTFMQQLGQAGYVRVQTVNEPRQFALRGSLLDLFPMGAHFPIRLDFFDDDIEQIRTFDPDSQLSLTTIEQFDLLPAHEFSLNEQSIKRFRTHFVEHFSTHHSTYQNISDGHTFPGIEFFLPWLHATPLDSLLDYLPSDCPVLLCEGVFKQAKLFAQQYQQRFEQRLELAQPCLTPEQLFFNIEQLKKALSAFPSTQLKLARQTLSDQNQNSPLRPLPESINGFSSLVKLEELNPMRVICCLESQRHIEQCQHQLGSMNLLSQPIDDWESALNTSVEKHGFAIIVAPFSKGFHDPVSGLIVLTHRELFGIEAISDYQQNIRSATPHTDFHTALHSISHLELGEPIVHAQHGVGRYNGLDVLDVDEYQQDFVTILYDNADKLYVPINDIDLLSPYVGDKEHAPLHILGSNKWSKETQKAQKKIEDVAAQLLEVYAKREARSGKAIKLTDTYNQFANQFPFAETPDQTKAIEEVIHDLKASKPMDRLICGDVGFGKTEVAIRAAFITASAGLQVAILTPTTLLANQHYQNFLDRFSQWPINIRIVSRLQSNTDNKATLEQLNSGHIDIIIGTHRLIQQDVHFKQLGLVIIDEEHRFGVKQKERFKQMRAEVNLLAMTATPIPRTLNMAFSNLRDLSIIASPPPNRVAIQTFTREWDSALIKEAILREIHRGGQAFVIHNEISTIERMKRQLSALIPEATIGIAHGQMPEQQIEQVMDAFYHQRQQILLATTIIETGIDIPNANTIIINRSDKFGLAQLHQLRGRVGRSNHQAYAYLIVPSLAALKGDARARLNAIGQATALGAGFQLAIQDMEIRGAGELLGDQQKGHIQQLGFNLYMEMLERTIKQLSDQALSADTQLLAAPCDVQLSVNALIPSGYIEDIPTRLSFYNQISQAEEADQLQRIAFEMLDRFGTPPQEINHLLAAHELKLHARRLGIQELFASEEQMLIKFTQHTPVTPEHLIQQLSRHKHWKMTGPTKLRINAEMPDPIDRIEGIKAALSQLTTT